MDRLKVGIIFGALPKNIRLVKSAQEVAKNSIPKSMNRSGSGLRSAVLGSFVTA